MKYIFKIFCLIFLFISEYIFTVGNAQAQVLVQLRQPPRYQFKIEDMWKVTLNNTTQTTYNVFLYGIATKSGEGKIVDANTATFRLPPGVKVISGHDVSPINVIETNKNYEDAVKYTGGVPTGNYEICVSVYNADNNEVLGSECIEQSVEIISGIELLLPEDKSLVLNGPEDVETEYQKHDWNKEVKTGKAGLTDAEYDHVKPPPPVPPNLNINNVNGSFITFSWIVPSPAPRGGNLTYTLTLTEMLGRQSAYDAIESNPAFFKSANLIATTYQYPSISRGFVSGKRYAWKVTAYLNGVKMTESEINEFSYRDNNLQTFTKNGKTKVWRHEGMSWLTSEIDKSSIYDLKLNEGVGSSPLLKTKSPILFYGSSTLEGVNSNRKGTGSDLPQRYANLTLTPSIAFYGLPFSTSILLSTLGTSNMQNVNSYSIGFDPATLKDMIQKRVDNEIDKAKTQIEQKVKEKSDSYRKELENQMIGLNYDTLKLKNDIKYQKDIENKKQQIEQKVTENEANYRDQVEGQIKDKTLKNLPTWVKIFNNVNSFGFGTNYPSYSQYTLNGVSVSGVDLDFNPGIFYIAGTALRNQKAIDNVAFKRNLYAGRLGIGIKDKSHFIVTLMHAYDDAGSIKVDTSNKTLTPKANWLMGLNGKVNLFNDKLSVEGEGVLSMLTRNITDPDIISDAIPKWVRNLFKPTGSSSADYMYGFKGSYENVKSNTKITAEMKMIGAGFYTLGNPNLTNDKRSFEGRIDQKFLDNKISTSLSIKNYRDNLLDTKTATTTTTIAIFRLGMRFRGYPSLNLTFIPNFQKNDKQIITTDSSKIDNKSYSFTGISSYPFKLGNYNTLTSIIFSYNNSKTLFGLYDYWTKTSQLTESFSFKFPLYLTSSIGMVQTLSSQINYSRIITFAVTGSYTIKEIWQNGGGLDVAVEKDKNKRIGFFINSDVVIGKYLTVDVRAEQVLYTDYNLSLNNYKDFMLRATLSSSW